MPADPTKDLTPGERIFLTLLILFCFGLIVLGGYFLHTSIPGGIIISGSGYVFLSIIGKGLSDG
jgi:hypothetical protein